MGVHPKLGLVLLIVLLSSLHLNTGVHHQHQRCRVLLCGGRPLGGGPTKGETQKESKSKRERESLTRRGGRRRRREK